MTRIRPLSFAAPLILDTSVFKETQHALRLRRELNSARRATPARL